MNDSLAYLGLGSNLGDSLTILQQARQALDDSPGLRVVAGSALYRTTPVGGPSGQADYLNAALEIVTALAPLELLQRCQAIEADFGRQRNVRWGARTLDIDLLLYDDRIIDSDVLQLPHPRLAERGFVLQPLCDLAPETIHPQSRLALKELLQQISPLQGVHRLRELW